MLHRVALRGCWQGELWERSVTISTCSLPGLSGTPKVNVNVSWQGPAPTLFCSKSLHRKCVWQGHVSFVPHNVVPASKLPEHRKVKYQEGVITWSSFPLNTPAPSCFVYSPGTQCPYSYVCSFCLRAFLSSWLSTLSHPHAAQAGCCRCCDRHHAHSDTREEFVLAHTSGENIMAGEAWQQAAREGGWEIASNSKALYPKSSRTSSKYHHQRGTMCLHTGICGGTSFFLIQTTMGASLGRPACLL